MARESYDYDDVEPFDADEALVTPQPKREPKPRKKLPPVVMEKLAASAGDGSAQAVLFKGSEGGAKNLAVKLRGVVSKEFAKGLRTAITKQDTPEGEPEAWVVTFIVRDKQVRKDVAETTETPAAGTPEGDTGTGETAAERRRRQRAEAKGSA